MNLEVAAFIPLMVLLTIFTIKKGINDWRISLGWSVYCFAAGLYFGWAVAWWMSGAYLAFAVKEFQSAKAHT